MQGHHSALVVGMHVILIGLKIACTFCLYERVVIHYCTGCVDDDEEEELHVLGCRLTWTNFDQCRFSVALRPQKPQSSLGRKAQDGHLDSHTAPELCFSITVKKI